MNFLSKHALLEATRLTRAGRLDDATTILRQSLAGTKTGSTAAPDPKHRTSHAQALSVLDGLGETLRGVLGKAGIGGGGQGPVQGQPRGEVREPGQFQERHFSNKSGSRPYKLYVPANHRGSSALVVMLHGCTQSPDDFAAGTRMNAVAEEHGFLVAYPAQIASANNAKCWNWFNPGDQVRDRGEPSLIAGITREVMDMHGIDPGRVYVAGMSAGGAAAAILGDAYPDLYAAIGVHSGLACGAANDLPSGFAAMRNGGAPPASRAAARDSRLVPTIVFHGTRDSTVHPSNADAVVAQRMSAARLSVSVEQNRVPGGHAYRRVLHADAAGKTVLEQWQVEGGGHAWSGGSTAGTYTDPLGPDASREMARFFLDHRHPAG